MSEKQRITFEISSRADFIEACDFNVFKGMIADNVKTASAELGIEMEVCAIEGSLVLRPKPKTSHTAA